ncbi:hypothetical protein CXB51_002454 [Gossypium anomalum]|uniref:Uncharacterized protein n=1 Tax=Gossypium anomalum TaxID=47600 RepID=A0A8J6DCM9_9ROSI|nr:hypothetical protein CXB51_002454 [Gossypium anomalum]
MSNEFADKGDKIIYETEAKGFNPGLIVLLVIGGLLITFLVGNYILYSRLFLLGKRSPYPREEDETREAEARSLSTRGVGIQGPTFSFSPLLKTVLFTISVQFRELKTSTSELEVNPILGGQHATKIMAILGAS